MERQKRAANPQSSEATHPAVENGIVSLYAARLAALPAKTAPDLRAVRVIPFGRGTESPTPIVRVRRRPA